jgi:hypothetical protein
LVKLIISIIVAAAVSMAGTLRSEAESFLERLYSQGYTHIALMGLEVGLMEPCTVNVYSPQGACSDGFYAALGGNNILDLGLRLEGNGWWLEDRMPDDIPVIHVDSIQISGSRRLIICANDMLRGFRTDSVFVVWALLPVDRNL